ncbi:MAG: hypothetical protein RIM99_16075 [Cyclobacteriaceae bacterium]
MKMINKALFGLVPALMLTSTITFGQIDQERMERDLKIAENILGTLSNNDRNIFSISRSIESNYIPEYGVIFSLPQNSLIYTARSVEGIAVIEGRSTYSSGSIQSAPKSDKSLTNDEKVAKEKKEYEDQMKKVEEQLKDQMTLFLVDYADLIGQLKPTDKIMVNVKRSNNQIWVSGSNLRSDKGSGKTAEILKSDLIAYKSGKASREETIKKINFTDTGDESKERDLELFSSIFSRLYEEDLSSTYYSSSRNINYERLAGLGAIFSMRVYSSREENGRHIIQTTGESGLTREERDSRVTAMYPEFERSFKENMLDYGRTVKSLKPSEMLMFKVRLTECKGCDMPKSIELSIKAGTLMDFDSGKINRENALKTISVKKTDN